MTKCLFITSMIYVAAALDGVLAPTLEIRGVSPDFLALAAASCAFVTRDSRGFLLAGAAGGVADLNGPGRLGVGMTAFALVGFALHLARRFTRRRPLVQAVVTWPAATLLLLSVAFVRKLLGELPTTTLGIVSGSVGAGFYTSLIALPWCLLMHRFLERRAAAH